MSAPPGRRPCRCASARSTAHALAHRGGDSRARTVQGPRHPDRTVPPLAPPAGSPSVRCRRWQRSWVSLPRHTDIPMATAMEMKPPDAAMQAPFEKNARRIGVVGVPPPEEGRGKIDGNTQQLEPWSAKLRLEAQSPSRPLRRRPDGDQHDGNNDGDLAPQDLGGRHPDPFGGMDALRRKGRAILNSMPMFPRSRRRALWRRNTGFADYQTPRSSLRAKLHSTPPPGIMMPETCWPRCCSSAGPPGHQLEPQSVVDHGKPA